MRLRKLALALIATSCSAGAFSTEDKKTSECFAMSIVYKNIAEGTSSPHSQIEALKSINTSYTRIFQNTVAQITENNGDVNSYSAMTKDIMKEVAADPLKWETKFRRCAQ